MDMGEKKPKKKPPPKPIMAKIKAVFDDSGMSMQTLGEAMGYESTTARQAVSQFLKSTDPRISMVIKFAEATGKKVEDFLK
jgi:hypothetical protein